ncbi:hypothetical protein HKX48_000441 [Thoreauomyces humboldtii]|nr:hypothetical protein HKX48_000441 [Thoreauomyces humboldtii]
MMEYESGNGYPGQGNNFYTKKGDLILSKTGRKRAEGARSWELELPVKPQQRLIPPFAANRRIIYLAVPPAGFFKNLNVPLENLK